MNIGEQRHEIDPNSGTWLFISEWVEKEISSLRERNDSLNLDQIRTAAIRGEIAALQRLAKLPNNQTAAMPSYPA